MTRARRDAMANLDNLVAQWIAGHSAGPNLKSLRASHWRAYRRALRALLRERALVAMDFVPVLGRKGSKDYRLSLAIGRAVYAAVVAGESRPTRAAVLGRRK